MKTQSHPPKGFLVATQMQDNGTVRYVLLREDAQEGGGRYRKVSQHQSNWKAVQRARAIVYQENQNAKSTQTTKQGYPADAAHGKPAQQAPTDD